MWGYSKGYIGHFERHVCIGSRWRSLVQHVENKSSSSRASQVSIEISNRCGGHFQSNSTTQASWSVNVQRHTLYPFCIWFIKLSHKFKILLYSPKGASWFYHLQKLYVGLCLNSDCINRWFEYRKTSSSNNWVVCMKVQDYFKGLSTLGPIQI